MADWFCSAAEVLAIGGFSIDKTLLKVAENFYICMFSNFVIPSVSNYGTNIQIWSLHFQFLFGCSHSKAKDTYIIFDKTIMQCLSMSFQFMVVWWHRRVKTDSSSTRYWSQSVCRTWLMAHCWSHMQSWDFFLWSFSMKGDENCNIVCIPLLWLCCHWFVEWCKIIREVNKWKEVYRKPVFSEL